MAEDFLAQVRTLNPDLKDYDDQTLAAAIGDQHPDYKPRLAKYFPETAANQLAQQGAQGIQGANQDVPVAPLEGEEKKTFQPTGHVAEGATNFVKGMTSPTSLGLVTGMTALAPVAPLAATVLGAGALVHTAWDTVKQIPELYRDLKAGMAGDQVAMGRFEEKATEAGLNVAALGLGTYVGHKVLKGEPATVPDPAAEMAAKTAGKAAEAVSDIPGAAEAGQEMKAAQEAVAEKATVPAEGFPESEGFGLGNEQPEHLQANPAVKLKNGEVVSWGYGQDEVTVLKAAGIKPSDIVARGTKTRYGQFQQDESGFEPETEKPYIAKPVETPEGKILPNQPPSPLEQQKLLAAMRAAGVDLNSEQAQAAFMSKFYGLKKPLTVASVGEVPVSDSSEAANDYPINLAGGTVGEKAGQIAHETQHARLQEGQIQGVPEGPGANDQIAAQTTQDILPKYAANINLNRLDIPQNAKQAILDYADHLQRQTPIPHEQTVADATGIGMSLDDATKLAASTSDLHAQVTAARQIEGYAANKFTAAQANLVANPADPAARAGMNLAVKEMISTMQASSDVAANVGRALSSFNIKAQPNAFPSEIGDLLVELNKKGKVSQDIVDKLAQTDLSDPIQRNKLRTSLTAKNATLMQKVSEYFLNSILSGIPTQTKKLASDLTIAGPQTFLEKTAGGAPGEASARLVGTFSGLNDALQAFVKSWQGQSEHFQPTPAIGGKLGTVIRTPTRALGAITDFVRQMNQRGSLYEQGYAEARAEGKSFSEAFDHAKDIADNPSEEQLSKANADANERVLLSKPGEFGSGMYALRRSTALGKIVAPVLQIPMNIAKYGTQLSPLGAVDILRRVATGEQVPTERVGRMVIGTALWAYVKHLVDSGNMTGSGPIDPVERDRLYQTGWRPYSIHAANGKFYPLYWLGPAGFSMGMAANAAEIMKESPRAVSGLDMASIMSAHVGKFILDQPYMQGLNNMVKSLNDPNWAPRWAAQTLGGFVPSLAARGAAAADPYERQMSDFMTTLKARVPFLREEVPTKRDIRGNPLPAPGTPAERFLSPMAVGDQVAKTPSEIAMANSRVGANPGYLKYNGRNLVLDPTDRDRYDQLVGAIVDRKMKAIDMAPSIFNGKSSDQQQQRMKDIVSGARAEGAMQMLREMKKRGTLQAYADAATGKVAARAQRNPYTETLDVPGAAQAEALMDRFQLPSSEKPKNVPDDLSDEYQHELDKAHAMTFYPFYSNPTALGSLPFDDARQKVQNMEKLAVDHAAKETLRRANMLKGVKSPSEAQ